MQAGSAVSLELLDMQAVCKKELTFNIVVIDPHTDLLILRAVALHEFFEVLLCELVSTSIPLWQGITNLASNAFWGSYGMRNAATCNQSDSLVSQGRCDKSCAALRVNNRMEEHTLPCLTHSSLSASPADRAQACGQYSEVPIQRDCV